MRNQQNIEQLLRRVPKKWAIAIVAVVIAYTLAQPILNSQFGWSLPGINSNQKELDNQNRPSQDLGSPSTRQTAERQLPGDESSASTNESANADFEDYLLEIAPDGTSNQSELYDYLQPLGRGKYQSPRGLIYTRSSDDRHRILHIARHLQDQPNRPGKHGVFDGDIVSVLRLIDDTYSRALKRQRGTSEKQQGDRTVLEAEFTKSVGFIGGRDGGRRNNPDARRVRVVVADKNVITAFPF